MSFFESPWFGYLAIAYGVFTAVLRPINPGLFRKLGPVQARFGKRAGTWMHVCNYSVLPIVLGVVTLIRAGVLGAR